jgi:hypothetical protein
VVFRLRFGKDLDVGTLKVVREDLNTEVGVVLFESLQEVADALDV